ncbi:P-loop containing nucleoside triphosphate hydrolase protein [Hygrophoropsis aurantiaca]|uniref:P-loop containing nucleoside triphosphate hydrolase protein n=1 Tax=Hygrophoropsis aurantiaca TaxID=72124 RepID=A0ACB8A222_9AGAM|nr:P-loop containing nucleoside triphosphate hydrolase protein [Hygrophoropsis aurantiaca]
MPDSDHDSHISQVEETSAPSPPKFPFNEEMDRLWQNCVSLVLSGETGLLKPHHLALVLLFDNLHSAQDLRLLPRSEAPPLSNRFELPLFWIVISRASVKLPQSLDDHIRQTTYKSNTDPSLHLSVGQALWDKIQEDANTEELEASTNGEVSRVGSQRRILILTSKQHILNGCTKATQLVLEKAKELCDATVRSPLCLDFVRFAIDLTKVIQEKEDRKEHIDPMVGRNYELRRLIAILSRHKKNNAVLLGDPGVGKTAIAEGLALRIVRGEVPESVVARVFSLDLAALLASTACKSAYEQVVKMILDEIADHEERGINAIIFIDNLSQITIGGYRGDGTGLLPDAAIDLIDDACVMTKLGQNANWEALGRLRRRRLAIELDIRSLEREVDEDSDRRLKRARARLQNVDKKIGAFKTSSNVSRVARNEIEQIDEEIKNQERLMMKYGQAGQRDERLQCVQRIFELREKKLETELKMQELGSASTGSSVDKIEPPAPSEQGKQSVPKLMVVGQPQAVEAVASAVRCMMGGLKDPSRPVASFLFGGPSGSGKTLLIKELANFALRSSGRLIRINASDYREPHSLSRLIGTPACTGFDKGGQLTECVRRKPFSVVHIKDIENACEEFRLLIQTILDEGSVRDGEGNTVDFTNCMIIVTTSVGQASIRQSLSDDDERAHFLNEVHHKFPVEFLSRLDEVVVFRRISVETAAAIISARLEELRKQLSLIRLHMEVQDRAQWHLEAFGWSLRSGARRLERVIRSEVLQPLASLLLGRHVREGWTVFLDYDDELAKIRVQLVPAESRPIPVTVSEPESESDSESSDSGESSVSTSYHSLLTGNGELGMRAESSTTSLDLEQDEEDPACGCNARIPPPASLGHPPLKPMAQRVF